MQRIGDRFVYAASDLNDYLQCKRLAELEALVARERVVPPQEDDPQADLIRRKGDEHEQRYLEQVTTGSGEFNVVRFDRCENTIESFLEAERLTREAMETGAAVIYQATFFDGTFLGRADFLRRVETPSALGAWSYEVLDTKLAVNPKPYFLVQLCNYSEHLSRLQSKLPEYGHIVLGDGSEKRYRINDYLAYYRRLRSRFLEFVTNPQRAAAHEPTTYPHGCSHCSICAWDDACTQRREEDDHLSLVAGMRRDQIANFEAAGITTVAGLARASDAARPASMAATTFEKLARQASLQVRGRENHRPIHELLDHTEPLGFTLLPEPAPGDVFFDMEGDPLYEPHRGLEYLFGCWMPDDQPQYCRFWALNRSEEKTAFEQFVDFIVARRAQYPAMHVYHYASYEKTALRRLAQVYCSREEEIDVLLRAEVFVDLYAVVRQSVAISEDGYGLKKLERFYRLARTTDVKKGDESIVEFERWLQNPDESSILDGIEAYNRDDCRSTHLLREWLLERRTEAIATFGYAFPLRPVKQPDAPCHAEFMDGCKPCEKRAVQEREDRRRGEVERELLAGILPPQTEDEYGAMRETPRIRYLMGNLLAYHRREEKPQWWTYFDRCENVDRLRDRDREAIGEISWCGDIVPFKRSVKDKHRVFTFTFPEQYHKLGEGDLVHDPLERTGRKILELVDMPEKRLLQLKLPDEAAARITALIPGPPLKTNEHRKALGRIAERLVTGDLQRAYPATFDLLAARNPRITAIGFGAPIQPAKVTASSVSAVVQALDRSYLFIQGPPGSGKTTVGAEIICDLLERGKRIGITSTGHKAIHHLLGKVERCMAQRGARFRGLYKHSDENAGSQYESTVSTPCVTSTKNNKEFESFSLDLAAGTSWLFTREDFCGVFDYVFVDEAGQVSLADAVAVSACAKNVVLLGDPSQLAQVSQGVHPLHAGDSVLQHVLGQAVTIAQERGIFLDRTYRMQPQICSFISESMYEGRLQPDPQTSAHCVTESGDTHAGLRYVPVEHAGNSSRSQQEADAIVDEVRRLRTGTVTDSSPDGVVTRPLEDDDIIVVTPYNAQRRLLTQTLAQAGFDIRVGTVDKFQGREAPVVFYSMATSSGDDLPRDLAFLFERNRFNVAVSRARALSFLVCSPNLLDIACKTTEQMALVNLLCSFVQRAQERSSDALTSISA